MAANQRYMHPIPSVRQVNPTLPGILGNVDLNRAIAADSPIAPEDLTHAKAVATTLKGIEESGQNPAVARAAVQSAELRVRAVEGAHAAAQYAPLNLQETLAQILQRLDTISERVETISETLEEVRDANTTNTGKISLIAATTHNHRVIGRNMRTLPDHCEPLQKTIPGDGVARALAVTRRRGLVAPPQPAAIGDVPAAFNPRIADYTRDDIANLIIFYNDDFVILPDDSEGTRRDKFRSFLSMY
ncbi:hypothetical protein FPV67DRAFT_1782240 [Lyophyllum atratum]|nr:hypothetical protein FPV67DRAFT_1782240 [Lyophyllum atratum]